MRRPTSFPLILILAPVLAATLAVAQQPALTLNTIMQDPDWLGATPESVRWTDDGSAIYYNLKRPGSTLRDLHIVGLDGVSRRIDDADLSNADSPGGSWTLDRSRKVFSRNGDIFLKDIATGATTQLTRTSDSASAPMFLADESRIAYRRGQNIIVRDLATGFEEQPFDVRAANDPEDRKDEKTDYLKDQQHRLFEIVRKNKRNEDEQRARRLELRDLDGARAPKPWYLGDKVTIAGTDLSTAGDAMLVRTTPKGNRAGKRDNMPVWVNEAGYVENREVRTLVGTGEPTPHSVLLLRLGADEPIKIDLSTLPMFDDDPLADLRAAAEARAKAKKDAEKPAELPAPDKSAPDKTVDDNGAAAVAASTPAEPADAEKKPEPKPKKITRSVTTFNVQWSDDGSRVAFWARSSDNKDRWLCVVDAATGALTAAEHLRDEAWINFSFSQFGWMPDNETLWLLSERSGWSHLYLAPADGSTIRALTEGDWEVRSVTRSADGSRFFVTASREHPGSDDLYEIDAATGAMTRLSSLTGRNSYNISPDERHVAFMHSTTRAPADLYVQPLFAGATPRRLTDTVSDEFLAHEWAKPEVVPILSSHSEQPIWSRIYTPSADTPGIGSDGRRPAVMFVHGAGYLQNAHLGWSNYFREFMFHTLLTRLGYVVIDMDYRASAGYGRDWRTAIYRRMGEPELEDFADGIAWLVEHKNVDPGRVGVYGGSYGGFMTLMGLFRTDLFAAGAALRPVTDWAHYNHGYTSNILNTPDIDPDAYERSSPIEFAAGLSKPLLICHGMVDDNVFFKDTVRLAQALIELEKEDWEVAMYPVEPHGFREPSSWLDEYRRILKLFETHLK